MEQLRMSLEGAALRNNVVPELPAGFRLRSGVSADIPAYIDLMNRAGFTGWNEASAEATFASQLDNGIFFVEEIATGRLAATAFADKNPIGGQTEGGALGWVGADPDFRGRHFGTVVCNAALQRHIEAGYTKVWLLTDDFRLPALKTYLKRGWLPFITCDEVRARWKAVYEKLNMKYEEKGV